MRYRLQFEGCTGWGGRFFQRIRFGAGRSARRAAACLLAASAVAWAAGGWAGAGQAQSSGLGSSGSPRVTRGGTETENGRDPSGMEARLQEHMEQRRNSDRQKQLIADTDKLLFLAQQLHEEVGKSSKDELSLTVLKKSDEIEKLAKSVKERMRGY